MRPIASNMRSYLIIVLVLWNPQIVNCINFMDSLNNIKDKMVSFLDSVTSKILVALKIRQDTTPSVSEIVSRNSQKLYGKVVSDIASSSLPEIEPDEDYIKLTKEPTALLRTNELIHLHNMTAEVHLVQTKDGFILQLHRILLPNEIISKKKTVLMQHGLLGSSADWVLLGRHKALPYMLSDAGYDVWLLNARGNVYSRRNSFFSSNHPSFWNFSFHEIGQLDVIAVLDYVRLRKDNDEKMIFIAHSTGASALLISLTSYPKYNNYLQMGILLAPLAFLTDTKGPLRLLAAINHDSPEFVTGFFGTGEFYPNRVPTAVAVKYCKGPLLCCRNPLFFLVGSLESTPLTDTRFKAQLLCHVPAGSSMRNVLHLAQLVRTGRFHPYNAPQQEYQLQRITVPLLIFSSTDDLVSTVIDGSKIFVNVVNPVEHVVLKEDRISHTEFVWGRAAPELIYSRILVFLKSNISRFTNNEV